MRLRPMLTTILTLSIACSCAAQEAATLTIGPGTPVNRMLFGMNEDWIGGVRLPGRSDVRTAVEALGLGTLRFPGGTISSFWDMPAGKFMPDDVINGFGFKRWTGMYTGYSHRNENLPRNALSAASFARLCRNAQAQPVWVLNMITANQANELESVDLLSDTWKGPMYIEMGNEVYLGPMAKLVPSATTYLKNCVPVIEHIRQRIPGAKLALAASASTLFGLGEPTARSQRERDWNDLLTKSRGSYDAWVVHSYCLGPPIINKLDPKYWARAALAVPQVAVDAVAERCRRDYGGIPVWLTEYNASFHWAATHANEVSPATPFFNDMRNSPLHALLVSGYLIGVVNNSDIYKVACYHSLCGMDGFGVVRFPETDGTTDVTVNPVGQVFAHISSIASAAAEMHSVSIAGNPAMELPLLGKEQYPALQAAAFSSKDKLTVLVLNRSDKAVGFTFDSAGFAGGTTVTYSANPAPKPVDWSPLPKDPERLPWSKPLSPAVGELKPSAGRVKDTAPPYSLTIVELTPA